MFVFPFNILNEKETTGNDYCRHRINNKWIHFFPFFFLLHSAKILTFSLTSKL